MPAVRPALSAAYRRTGADLPHHDPAAAHGVAMEGYYWRLVDHARGRVVVVLCGVVRSGSRRWAVVAIAAHPGGHVRHAVVEDPLADAHAFGVRAGAALVATPDRLTARLGDEDWVDVELAGGAGAPRGLGPAHVLPWLPQYWTPLVLGASVRGSARVGGDTFAFDGASAYVEKNWGPGFPGAWWWGHADGFAEPETTVAFAGGPLAGRSATAVVVRAGGHRVALSTPLARVRFGAGQAWSLRARRGGWSIELESDGAGIPHLLPVPDPATGALEMRSRQHLAATVGLRVTRRGSTLIDATTTLAGLERGSPRLSPPPRDAPRR